VVVAVHQFLDEALPTYVENGEKGTCQVLATVFIDYVPLPIEVRAFADGADVSVVFKQTTQNDVIRFKQLFDQFVAFFRSLNMKVTTLQQASARSGLIDDDFDDSDDESVDDDEPSWSQRVELVLADAVSPIATMREHAFQCLARWVASAPASHAAVAEGLVKYATQLGLTLLTGPLAEMYPASAMLRSVACGASPEAQKLLSESTLYTLLAKLEVSTLPSLVTRELTVAVQSLQKVSNEKQCLIPNETHCFIKKKTLPTFASNSTRCTDLDSIHEFSDLESSGGNSTCGMMDSEVRHKTFNSTFVPDMPAACLHFYSVADNLFEEDTD
jgi:hypothetical protein